VATVSGRQHPVVRAVATELCPAVPQSAVRDLALELWPQLAGSRYASVFDNAGIDHRRLAQPLEWYRTPHDPASRAALAVTHGEALAASAARSALTAAGVEPADVDAVIVSSTTVVRSPGLDAPLVAALGLRHDVRRVSVAGPASLGGVGGLALGADLVRGGHRVVLLVAVELNTLSFSIDSIDPSMPVDPQDVVTLALFSDGAAAVVLAADGDGPAVVASRSELVPDSLWVMGFDLGNDGLRWRLHRDVPKVAAEYATSSIAAAVAAAGWETTDIDHLLVHPGGLRVLAAVADAAGVDEERLAASYAVLRANGNVSGVTALAVLAHHLDHGPDGGRMLLTAMGPGFGFEHVLLDARLDARPDARP
jgi:alkylresorcinol/alkylpyrone synthase